MYLVSTLKKSSVYRTLSEAKAKMSLLSDNKRSALKLRRKVAIGKRLPAKLRHCDKKGSYIAGIDVTESETSDQGERNSDSEPCGSETTSNLSIYDSDTSLSDGWELELL